MLLSARMLIDVASVNAFEYTTQLKMTQGDQTVVYFQLIDASLDTSIQGFYPSGRRYVPGNGSVLSVVFDNIDDARKITRSASQPFSSDKSIWSVPVYGSDNLLPGTISLKLTLTDGSVVTRGVAANVISVYSLSGGA